MRVESDKVWQPLANKKEKPTEGTKNQKCSEKKDPYDLDLNVKHNPALSNLGADSHGCTVGSTCEGCRQTDNCNHSHYCATQNRCGHTDECGR